jgi:integrase
VCAAVDAFLSSPRVANPNTRRAYAGALDRVLDELGPAADLVELSGEQLAEAMERLWGHRAPATWNRNRAAIAAWLTWCRHAGLVCPILPATSERRRETADATRALSRTTIERALSRRDVPLREKTLWRMLFETAARAGEVLALNIEDLDLDARRAPVRSTGVGTGSLTLALTA